jgi:FtsP/CotA-like multicopper oxidase with cupredoxin domain
VTRGQRLTFLGIAAVIAVVAVILLAGGGDETDNAADSARTPAATATPTTAEGDATATPTPTATPKPKPPLLQAGKVRTLTYDQGDTVRFRVRSDEAEEVHIHGYDIKKDLEPGQTATVSFKASITGIFEIEFEGSATQIAELKVEP